MVFPNAMAANAVWKRLLLPVVPQGELACSSGVSSRSSSPQSFLPLSSSETLRPVNNLAAMMFFGAICASTTRPLYPEAVKA